MTTFGTMHLPVLGPMAAVLDGCAMIAYLRGEPGGDLVYSIISNPANTSHAHVINLLEVYYEFRRVSGPIASSPPDPDLEGCY